MGFIWEKLGRFEERWKRRCATSQKHVDARTGKQGGSWCREGRADCWTNRPVLLPVMSFGWFESPLLCAKISIALRGRLGQLEPASHGSGCGINGWMGLLGIWAPTIHPHPPRQECSSPLQRPPLPAGTANAASGRPATLPGGGETIQPPKKSGVETGLLKVLVKQILDCGGETTPKILKAKPSLKQWV